MDFSQLSDIKLPLPQVKVRLGRAEMKIIKLHIYPP
jgi:hypothetical protein